MSASRVALNIFLVALVTGSLAFRSLPVEAESVVGTGSPGSCTEAAFDTVFYAVQAAGGTITFNCGTAPITILFSAQKPVSANTVINGGGLVSLSGANKTGLFQVYSGQTLTLSHIILTHGLSTSGAVENFGTLNVTDSRIQNSSASGSGGGISNHGTLNLTNAVISGNTAAQYGGGFFTDDGTVTITNSQVTGNTAVQGGGGIAAAGTASLIVAGSTFSVNRATDTFAQGGAVLNNETANTQISGSTFTQNSSSRGGAISVMNGALSVTQSVISGNWAAYGGGIRQESGTLALTRVKLSGNGYSPSGTRVTTGGGALSWGDGTATLSHVTISNNWASYGGGFDHSAGTTTLSNVTISGNQAVGSGGFDQNGGSVSLENVTIVNNSAGFFGGGIGNRTGTLSLQNTLLVGNFKSDTGAGWNCYKQVGSTLFSLSSDFSCTFGAGRDNVKLNLSPLQDIDPQTQVHLPLKGSPAIDNGSGAGCPLTDQRQVSRPQGVACDIGAVEVTTNDKLFTAYLSAVIR